MTASLAAVILTNNSERHIDSCLASLTWTDEQVVFDDQSTDRTVDLALQHGARVVRHPLQNWAAQRDAALAAVDADWILFVDSDERATPLLAQEVRQVIEYTGAEERAGWWIPRHNYMIGHRMRGGGWYPDHQLRLLRRGKARYDPMHKVHEVVILDGQAGYLRQPFIHFNYDSIGQFRQKMSRYTNLEAQILQDEGITLRPWTPISMPLREFWRRFVTLKGYRDHLYGLLFCSLMAWYTYLTYRRFQQLRRPVA